MRKCRLHKIPDTPKHLNTNANATLISLASYVTDSTSYEYIEMLKTSSAKWKNSIDNIEQYDLLMPSNARSTYRELKSLVKLHGSNISRDGIDKTEMLKIINKIDALNSKLIDEIEKVI